MESDGDKSIVNTCEKSKSEDSEDGSCSSDEEYESVDGESSEDVGDDDEDEESDQASDDNGDISSAESSGSQDDDNSCAICLSSFRHQEIGIPESCDHTFCVDCIIEWSKNINTCPIDRKEFNAISVRRRLGESIYKKIPVEVNAIRPEEFEVLDDTTICEVCGAADNEDRLLLCDSCNHGYHTYCLTPRLEHVPRGDWYCPVCQPALQVDNNQGIIVSSDEDVSSSEPVQLGRTLVLERVRQMVARIRRSRAHIIDSDSESEEAAVQDNSPCTSRGASRQRRKTRKRKVRRRRRKQTGRKSSKKLKKCSGTSKRRKKGRRTKRRKVRKIKTTTIAKRLSARLGIKPCYEGNKLIIKTKRKRMPILESQHINNTSLDIMGNYNNLIPNSDHSEDEGDVDQSGTCLVSRSVIPRIGPRLSVKEASIRHQAASEGSTDLLGTILDGQNLLLADSESVVITRDGRIKWDSNNNSKSYRQRGDNRTSHDKPQDGGSEQTNRQMDNDSNKDKASTSEGATHHVSSTADQSSSCSRSSGMLAALGANTTNSDGINLSQCTDNKDKRDSDVSEDDSPTKSTKVEHCDSTSALNSGSTPSEQRTTTSQPKPSDAQDHEQKEEEEADIAVDIHAASDGDGSAPAASYLYSPESPTSCTDSVHVGSTPTMDDGSRDVADGGSTPVVDEVSVSVSEQPVGASDTSTTDLFHIVPFCELPKIPKIKKKPPENMPKQQEANTSPSYTGVLERLNMADKQDSYPKWDKVQRDKPEKRRKSSDFNESAGEDDSDSGKRSHHGEHLDDDESRSSYKNKGDSRSHSRDYDKSYDKEKDRRYDRGRRHRSSSSERSRRSSDSRSRDRRSDCDYTRSHRSRSRSRSPHYRDHHIRGGRYKDQEHALPASNRRFKMKHGFSSELSNRCNDGQQTVSDLRDKNIDPFFHEMDPKSGDCSVDDDGLAKQTDISVNNDNLQQIPSRTAKFSGGRNIVSPEPSPVFKMPEAPPPRFHKRDNIQMMGLSPDLSYDPSQPTEPDRSPPHLEEFVRGPGHLTHMHRQSPIQARLPYAEVVHPHRGPLLADPSPPREPPPAHFVTVPDGLRQMLPPLPGFGVIQPNLHPRNMRPPLLVNPPLISAHQLGRLPHLAGPQISWQAVSHPNVIIHNRIPIQVNQNGLPIHPNGPEAFLQPPPHLEHPGPQSVPESLATPPPPIPPKALEEMHQISQLLNAQAQLADIATKGDGVVHFRDAPTQFANSQCFLGPPPPLPNKPQNDAKSVTFEEKMEVIDMDVASPLSDQIGMSVSPIDSVRDTEVSRKHSSQQHTSRTDHLPKSAAELDSKEKRLRQERVVEEVKLAIKPHYSKGRVDKGEYKEILRKAVPKICHSKSGDINPERIRKYIEQYVEKVRRARKHGSKNK